MQVSTLRPGLLVSLKSSLTGNVSYVTRDIEPDHYEGDGARMAKWETARRIEDATEHEEAVKVRSKARSIITGCCAPSSFGLLCPEADRGKLTDAVNDARAVIDRFNNRAKLSRVSLYVIVGRVAADDLEAVRAINSEITGLLTAMETGLQRLDVDAVRSAANSARSLAAMLSPDAASRTEKAITAARSAARRIVKAGEEAAIEIDAATIRTIREARTAFLDYSDAADMQEPEAAGRAIDLAIDEAEISEPVPPLARPAAAPFVELEF